jgi:hypothetical protein
MVLEAGKFKIMAQNLARAIMLQHNIKEGEASVLKTEQKKSGNFIHFHHERLSQ